MKIVSTFRHAAITCSSAPLDAQAQARRAAGYKLLQNIISCPNTQESPPFVQFLDLPTVSAPPAWIDLEQRCLAATPHKPSTELRHALSPRLYPVPHTVNTAACHCSLTGTTHGRRFRQKHLNRFLSHIFQALPLGVQNAGLPKVELSQYDLHHAHFFLSSFGLGLLFHAKEYPASSDELDIGNLGNCQKGTPFEFDTNAMAWRNIIWIQNQAVSVNVGPASPLYSEILMDGLHEVGTVLESDLGEPLADIYFVEELGKHGHAPQHRIFIV